jgi:hypothetical protein
MAKGDQGLGATHIQPLFERLGLVLDPPLDVREVHEKAEVGAERVVVFLVFERGRDEVVGDDVQVEVSAGVSEAGEWKREEGRGAGVEGA